MLSVKPDKIGLSLERERIFMEMKIKYFIYLLCFSAVTSHATAQSLDPNKINNDYYQSALQAYLGGDLDKAILFDSKTLQYDPQDKKAQALLSILVSEKDTSNKTDIWIGGKPAALDAGLGNPEFQNLSAVAKEKASRTSALDRKKLNELETRVQTVAFLMERDSFNQYKELNSAQVQTTLAVKELSLNFHYMNIFLLIPLALAVIAIWKSWKTEQDIKKQMETISQTHEHERSGKVVHIRRM